MVFPALRSPVAAKVRLPRLAPNIFRCDPPDTVGMGEWPDQAAISLADRHAPFPAIARDGRRSVPSARRCLGRRSWLFAGSDRGGAKAARPSGLLLPGRVGPGRVTVGEVGVETAEYSRRALVRLAIGACRPCARLAGPPGLAGFD